MIKTGNHEIGHNFVNIEYFMENGKLSLETPRKKYLDFSEGGYYLEVALFGRILDNINLEQALYILNEKNYEKEYMKFQEGFNNINMKDLKVEGVFENLCNAVNLNNQFIKRSKSIFISSRARSQIMGVPARIRNDVIGRIYSEDNYDEMIKKYS